MVKKENKFNIPDLFCYARIFITLILIYIIINAYDPLTIIVLYAIAAITDGFDGFTARIFNQKTEFGRKLDIFADRFFMIGVIGSFIYYLVSNGLFTNLMQFYLVLLMSREIFTTPFFLFANFSRREVFPHARKIGKLTTLMQGFAFPILILGLFITPYFLILTGIIGLISGIHYAYDVIIIYKKNK